MRPTAGYVREVGIGVGFFRSHDRAFRNFRRVIALESSAASRYPGVTFELRRRLADAVQFRAAHTFGRVVDTLPDGTMSFAAPSRYDLSSTTLRPIAIFGRPLETSGERIMQLATRISL